MKKLQFAVLALIALFVTACNGDGGVGPGANIYGSYALQTVGGAALPANIINDPGYRVDITGGTVQLNTDRSYTYIVLVRITQGAAVTNTQEQSVGAFTQNGNAVILQDATDGTAYNVSITGSVLTLTDGSYSLVFRK